MNSQKFKKLLPQFKQSAEIIQYIPDTGAETERWKDVWIADFDNRNSQLCIRYAGSAKMEIVKLHPEYFRLKPVTEEELAQALTDLIKDELGKNGVLGSVYEEASKVLDRWQEQQNA